MHARPREQLKLVVLGLLDDPADLEVQVLSLHALADALRLPEYACAAGQLACDASVLAAILAAVMSWPTEELLACKASHCLALLTERFAEARSLLHDCPSEAARALLLLVNHWAPPDIDSPGLTSAEQHLACAPIAEHALCALLALLSEPDCAALKDALVAANAVPVLASIVDPWAHAASQRLHLLALRCLAGVVALHEGAKYDLCEAGGIALLAQLLGDAVAVRPPNHALAEANLRVLGAAVAACPPSRDALLACDGIAELAAALDACVASAQIVQLAALALLHCAAASPEARERALRSGALAGLARALRVHVAAPAVVEPIALALWNVSREAPACRLALAPHVGTLFDAIDACDGARSAQAMAAGAIGSVLAGCAEARLALLACGGLARLARLARAQADSALVQRIAVEALLAVLDAPPSDALADAVRESGILAGLAHAHAAHADRASLQQLLVGTVLWIAEQSPAYPAMLADAGCFDIITAHLATAPDDADAHIAGLNALMWAAKSSDALLPRLAAAGAVQLAVRALRRFLPRSLPALRAAAHMLRYTVGRQRDQQLFACDVVGAHLAVLQAMRLYARDALMQSYGSGALWSLVCYNQATQNRVRAAGGLRVLFDAMALHAGDDEVHQCLAVTLWHLLVHNPLRPGEPSCAQVIAHIVAALPHCQAPLGVHAHATLLLQLIHEAETPAAALREAGGVAVLVAVLARVAAADDAVATHVMHVLTGNAERDPAAAELMASAECTRAAARVLELWADVPATVIAALNLLWHCIGEAREAPLAALLRATVPTSCAAALAAHADNGDVCAMAAGLLWRMQSHLPGEGAELAAAPGLAEGLVAAMKAHAARASVVFHAAGALRCFARGSQDALAACGVFPALAAVLAEHAASDSVLEVCGFLTDRLVSHCDASKTLARTSGVLALMCRAAAAHRSSAAVTIAVATAIWSCASDSPENRAVVRAEGGLALLAGAFDAFPDDAALLSLVAGAIDKCAIGSDSAAREALCELDAVPRMLAALRRFGSSVECAQALLSALWTAVSCNTRAQEALRVAGGLETVLAIMRLHADDAEVQQNATGGLWHCAGGSAACRAAIVAADGPAILVAALARHEADFDSARFLAGALWFLAALSADARAALVANPQAESLLASVCERFPGTWAQREAVLALWALSNANVHAPFVARLGGVAALLAELRRTTDGLAPESVARLQDAVAQMEAHARAAGIVVDGATCAAPAAETELASPRSAVL